MLMIQELADVSNQALSLSHSDRATLAHALIQILDRERDLDIDEAWKSEIAKRSDRFQNGDTTDRDAFDVLNDVRSRFS